MYEGNLRLVCPFSVYKVGGGLLGFFSAFLPESCSTFLSLGELYIKSVGEL